jgi:hypothetical protein
MEKIFGKINWNIVLKKWFSAINREAPKDSISLIEPLCVAIGE